jgi:hypothetical protein
MNIPKELLEEAVRVSGAPTQTMAVVMGLQELIRKKKIQKLLRMKGSDALGLNQQDLRSLRKR